MHQIPFLHKGLRGVKCNCRNSIMNILNETLTCLAKANELLKCSKWKYFLPLVCMIWVRIWRKKKNKRLFAVIIYTIKKQQKKTQIYSASLFVDVTQIGNRMSMNRPISLNFRLQQSAQDIIFQKSHFSPHNINCQISAYRIDFKIERSTTSEIYNLLNWWERSKLNWRMCAI